MMDDFYIAFLYENDEERVRRLMERERLLHLRDTANPFLMKEAKFVKLFRLPPHGVLSLIDALSTRDRDIHQGDIPVHIKVLCTLNFYGQGCYQSSVGQDSVLGISQSTVSKCLNLVTDSIVSHLVPIYIKFAGTPEERNAVKQGFQALGFPNVIGAIDGTRVAVITPTNSPVAPKRLFYNRKGYYSINAQVICDAKGKIMNVNPNFPGSTHDSAVWGASNINRLLKEEYISGERNQWLLGDKGYPLVPWLMTPYPNASIASPAEQYNKIHTKARNVVELCFGKLKNRFRCLMKQRTLHYRVETAAKILLGCCTLHNMFINHLIDDFETPQLDEQPATTEVDGTITDFSADGLAKRDWITSTYFST